MTEPQEKLLDILKLCGKISHFFPEKSQNNLDKSTSLRYNIGVVIKEGYVRISYHIRTAEKRSVRLC